jgi:hypothetical protein
MMRRAICFLAVCALLVLVSRVHAQGPGALVVVAGTGLTFRVLRSGMSLDLAR